jgi:hypothetical protein
MISLILFRKLSRENRTKLCSLRPRLPLHNTNSCMNGPPSSHNSSFSQSLPFSLSSSRHLPHPGLSHLQTMAHIQAPFSQPPIPPDIISQFVAPQLSSAPAGWDWKEYVQLFHLLVSLLVLACSWLGLSFGREIGKDIGKRPSLGQYQYDDQETPEYAHELGKDGRRDCSSRLVFYYILFLKMGTEGLFD